MHLLLKSSRGLGKRIHFPLAPFTTKTGASVSHFFNGNQLNRNSEKREDKSWLSKVFQAPGAKVALFQKSDPLFTPCGTSIKWVSPQTLSPFKLDAIFKEEGTKNLPLLIYLGSKGDTESFWALQLDGLQPNAVIEEVTRDGGKFSKFRPGVFNLRSSEAAVMSQARAILDWNSKSQYCPSCGNKTVAGDMGYKRICFSSDPAKKSCSQEGSPKNYMHPRTDPVTIVCVSSEDGELCLLGRKADWPKDVYSCVAGFIEPGESIEEGAAREVYEEAGVVISNVRYHSSQPWPFPGSLVIGCTSTASSLKIESFDKELEDVKWIGKAEVKQALESRRFRSVDRSITPPSDPTPGSLILPSETSMAYQLIKHWVNS